MNISSNKSKVSLHMSRLHFNIGTKTFTTELCTSSWRQCWGNQSTGCSAL